jgi:nucleoside-diphosphate-sugar epimerase
VVALSSTDGDIASIGPELPETRTVIHLAAKTFVPESWQDPRSFYRVNVLGTVNMLEYCRQHNARFILLSSYVYGPPQFLPITEEHPLSAFNPYAQTKLMSEEAARSYEKLHNVAVSIIRPFNIYGPGQEPQFLIPSILRQALDPAAKAIRVADARPKRDYLYIDDLVRLVVQVAEQRVPGVFNAGTGESHSVADVARLANLVTGQAKPMEDDGPSRPVDVMDVYASIDRAWRACGWKPEVSLEEGLRRTAGVPAP